jgi:hypothetical protein
MLIINPPLAIYKHFAAFSFLLAGVFADLLVVRLCLSSAYIFLILNCLMGSPLWPYLRRPEHLTVDMLVWGIVCFYVHMCSIIRLLKDEAHVSLTDDEEALWRMFYRVGGMSRKVFKDQIAAHMKVVHFKKGQILPTADFFHMTYKGLVEIQVYENNQLLTTNTDGSGSMFDLKSLGLLQAHTPMANHVLKVVSQSDSSFFQFSTKDIRRIAAIKHTKGVWQTVLVGILARIAVARLPDEDPSHLIDPNHIDPLYLPLSKAELPDPLLAGSGKALEQPLAHIAYCMRAFFTPPWPFSQHVSGIRHGMLPAPVPLDGSVETLVGGLEPLVEDGTNKDSEYESLVKKNAYGSGLSKSYKSI